MKRLWQILMLFLYCGGVSAQVIQDSVRIQFRAGQSNLELELASNR